MANLTSRSTLRLSTSFNPKKLRELLDLEKKNRGVANDKLVFVGMANLAKYYWCAIHSVLDSREKELMFFGAYLEDRLKYSKQLGLIKKLPKNDDELLRVGDEITLDYVNKLLGKRKPLSVGAISIPSIDFVGKDGKKSRVLNPNLDPGLLPIMQEDARRDRVRIVDIKEAPPMARGNMLEFDNEEQYKTIRWNFRWGNYTIVGVPDGITEDFVYEYKTTATKFLSFYLKPCALVQADLYGYFFRRKKKRVQMHIMDDGTTQTWEELINEEMAIKTLTNFQLVDEGKLFPPPPKKWKCEKCEICKFGKLCQGDAG